MAQIIMPAPRQKDDALTTIMKGLTIASDIYGIRSNMVHLDELQKKAAADQNLSQGKYDKNQQLSLSEKYDISPTQPSSGQYQQIADSESGGPLYASLKKDNSPLLTRIATTQNGVKGEAVVNQRDLMGGRTPEQATLGFFPAAPDKGEHIQIANVVRDGQTGTLVVDPISRKEIGFFAQDSKDRNPVKIETIDEKGNPVIKLVPNEAGQSFAAAPKGGEKPNKEQFDAALYGRRIQTANEVFEKLSAQGYNRSSNIESFKSFIMPEALKSSNLKMQEQAERNFLTAVLRRESGSAINASEFEMGDLQYFPRAGDSPNLLAQKAQNREQALAGMQAAAGNAWEKVPQIAVTKPKQDTSGQAFASPNNNALLDWEKGDVWIHPNGHQYQFNGKDFDLVK